MRAAMAVLEAELRVAARRPFEMVLALAAPVIILVLASFLFSPGGRDIPIAVVPQGTSGIETQRIQRALESREGVPMYLHVVTNDEAEARNLLSAGRVFGVIELPSSFEEQVAQGESVEVRLTTYNAMADVDKNVRLSVMRALNAYSRDTYHAPFTVRVVSKDGSVVSRTGFLASGSIIYGIVFAGVLFGGVATARQWEMRTIKGLRVAPVSGILIGTGFLLANAIRSIVIGMIMVVVAVTCTGFSLPEEKWMMAAVLMLTSFFATAIGMLVGTLTRRFYATLPVAGITAILLWFLSGGFQDLVAVRGTFLFALSRVLPTSYAFDVLRGSNLEESVLLACVGVLAVMTVGVVAMSLAVLHRSLSRMGRRGVES